MLGTAATPPRPLGQSLTQLDAAQPPLESSSLLDDDQPFFELTADNSDGIPQSAEDCCRQIATGLYNAALQGWEVFLVILHLCFRTGMVPSACQNEVMPQRAWHAQQVRQPRGTSLVELWLFGRQCERA